MKEKRLVTWYSRNNLFGSNVIDFDKETKKYAVRKFKSNEKR